MVIQLGSASTQTSWHSASVVLSSMRSQASPSRWWASVASRVARPAGRGGRHDCGSWGLVRSWTGCQGHTAGDISGRLANRSTPNLVAMMKASDRFRAPIRR